MTVCSLLETNEVIVRPAGILCSLQDILSLHRERRDLGLVADYLTGGGQCGKACELYCHCIGVEEGQFKTYDVILVSNQIKFYLSHTHG